MVRLYKYAPIARIDILLNEAIRYTQPSALNDPYEMRVDFESFTLDDYSHFTGLSAAYATPEGASKYYDDLPEDLRSVLPITKEEFIARCLNVTKDPSGLAESTITLMRRLAPSIARAWLNAIDNAIGILSLSEVPDNLLMWSHYADQHNGIVIEFNSRHPTLNRAGSEPKDFHSCLRVTYSRARTTILNHYNLAKLLTKAEDWSYEKEWRIIKPLDEAKDIRPSAPFNIHLMEMPADCIKRVIFGARIPVEVVAEEAQKIRSQSKMSHVKLTRATLKIGEFGLDIDEPV